MSGVPSAVASDVPGANVRKLATTTKRRYQTGRRGVGIMTRRGGALSRTELSTKGEGRRDIRAANWRRMSAETQFATACPFRPSSTGIHAACVDFELEVLTRL
jgi:hypothetical protein